MRPSDTRSKLRDFYLRQDRTSAPDKSSKDRKNRYHGNVHAEAWARREYKLATPELDAFLATDPSRGLGGLPLSVQMFGHLLKQDDKGPGSVQRLLADFLQTPLEQVDVRGMNRRLESTQYFGLVAMFRTAVQRLLSADEGGKSDGQHELDAGTKRAALALLLLLSRLHGTLTPIELFHLQLRGAACFSEAPELASQWQQWQWLCSSYERAQEALVRFGLLKRMPAWWAPCTRWCSAVRVSRARRSLDW